MQVQVQRVGRIAFCDLPRAPQHSASVCQKHAGRIVLAIVAAAPGIEFGGHRVFRQERPGQGYFAGPARCPAWAAKDVEKAAIHSKIRRAPIREIWRLLNKTALPTRAIKDKI